jgi:DNA topoisomerase IA
MSKTLVIAEKPSVAADLARALGGKAARAEFFEVDVQLQATRDICEYASVYAHVTTYLYIYVCIYIYISIYIEREIHIDI